MIETIKSENAPKAIGPYSQGIKSGNMIFISGQLPYNNKGEQKENIEDQTIQCLKNIENILLETGADRKNIVKLTIFLKNIKDFPNVNNAFTTFFENCNFPARSTIEVSCIPKDANIEIDAIAMI